MIDYTTRITILCSPADLMRLRDRISEIDMKLVDVTVLADETKTFMLADTTK